MSSKFKTTKVIRDGKDPQDMYRLRFKDGEVSEDFYNLTRAKDHAARIDSYDARESPLEAH